MTAIALVVSAYLGCTSTDATPGDRAHAVFAPRAASDRAPASEAAEPFDFQRGAPAEFLELLATRGAGPTSGRFHCFTMEAVHSGWIRPGDLPALYRALDDARPCPAVVLVTSSIVPAGSTVSREAAFLIDGYWSDVRQSGYGGYPPAIHSGFATPADELKRTRGGDPSGD